MKRGDIRNTRMKPNHATKYTKDDDRHIYTHGRQYTQGSVKRGDIQNTRMKPNHATKYTKDDDRHIYTR